MPDAAPSCLSPSSLPPVPLPAGAAPVNGERAVQAASFSLTMDDAVALPQRVVRVAVAMRSVMTMLCGMTMLLTAAMLLDSATLQAHSVTHADSSATRNARQELARSLAVMLGQCESVLAVNSAGGSDGGYAGTDVVLWLEDSHDLGQINADELAVVRHSPFFQTVTLYSASVPRSNALRQPAWRGEVDNSQRSHREGSLTATALTSAELAAPGAIDRWRAHPAIQARVVATGISLMTIEPAQRGGNGNGGGNGALSLFRLRLTWDANSSDGADSASAVVEAGRRRSGALQQQEYQP